MKAISLTFSYDIDKIKQSGRFWADKVYSTEVRGMFEYPAASYATFIEQNPEIFLELYTNDIALLKECLEQYNVSLDKVSFIDFSEQINKSKEHPFCFQPLVDWLYLTNKSDEYVIRIDNDLIWKAPLPKFDPLKDVFVWKYERIVRDGAPEMGEILVCQTVCNNIDFPEFNIGVMGYPLDYPMHEFYDICNAMSSVDISSVSDLGVKVWHVCEQTAQCWILYKYSYNIIETHTFIEHWHQDKMKCIEQAKYLTNKII